MLVLSLFPGIGLLDMAFEEEGFTVVRGPDVLWGGDIRRFHPPARSFAGVIGGPPCQQFSSLAHMVRANGYEPKFGNLIPEFERCVAEAQPGWFLMENVRAAPVPVVAGYGVQDFLLDNSMIDSGDGWGNEQIRLRRFSFGVRGGAAPDLRRWITPAALLLPDAVGTLTQWTPDNSKEAKCRHETVTGGHDKPPSKRIGNGKAEYRKRRHAILGHGGEVPVKIGGGEKVKRTAVREGCVTGSDGGASVRMRRYRLADACRLQGLPEDFLADTPFTVDGKLKAVANGVPLPMGRAIARAVKEALKHSPAPPPPAPSQSHQ
ncbi:MAG: DNA cytosine methyltransferase [Planctomycetaceae bacterium]|nr:DNA cytosine methyltransferase [Planctomycetaceae bacterium]